MTQVLYYDILEVKGQRSYLLLSTPSLLGQDVSTCKTLYFLQHGRDVLGREGGRKGGREGERREVGDFKSWKVNATKHCSLSVLAGTHTHTHTHTHTLSLVFPVISNMNVTIHEAMAWLKDDK